MMRLFGKRKDEEEEYEDEEIGERSVKRRTRPSEFKDLKPESRKRRKEPKKPWGKMERLMILVVLFLTVGTSGVLALSARAWKLPGLPRLKMPSLTLPMFGEEIIVIEGRKIDQEKAQKVIDAYRESTKNLSGVWGLYIIRLENGYSYGVNENEVFEAASLIKLPVMAAMYMEAEEGSISLSSKYKLRQEDKVPGAGSLYSKPAGYEITYRNLIQLMGKQSDNTAFNICRKLLGDEKINEVIRKIGMVDTSIAKNETTPKDIGVFFEELWRGNVVSEEHRDEILDALTDTIYEDWLAGGVPEDIRVAHKYGREVHVVNDAGIVFAEKLSEPGGSPSRRPFVMVIMSKGVVEKEADEVFPELARSVYEIESSY